MKLLISAAVLLGLSQAAFGWLVEPLASTCSLSAYQGCYKDAKARIWPTSSTDPGKVLNLGTTNSPAKCREKCQDYSFFGVQAYDWCWCGNTAPPADLKQPESECHIDCPGDSDYKCGGSWRMNIHKQEVWQPSSNQGCYKDEDEARIWPTSGTDPGKVLNLGTTNSPAKCRENCQGYSFFGVQAYDWCWCGNTAPPADLKQPESECHIDCPGDSDYKCGGPWRMNIHKQEGKNIMTGLDIVRDTETQCKQGCGRQDSTCQVWKSLVAIRQANQQRLFDDDYFNQMVGQLANRKQNMAFTSCDIYPCFRWDRDKGIVERALSSATIPSTRTSFATLLSMCPIGEKGSSKFCGGKGKVWICEWKWEALVECLKKTCLIEQSEDSCQEKGCGVAIELYDRYEAASKGLMCSLYYNFNFREKKQGLYKPTLRMPYDFKESAHFRGREAYEYCDNDAAKSLKILWAQEGDVIKLCDDHKCDGNDDYTFITVKRTIPCGGWVVSGFESNMEDSYVKVDKFGGGNLDGKVSRVELLRNYVVERPDYFAIGKPCWDECKKREGKYCANKYCGTRGRCCRRGHIKNETSGCDPFGSGMGLGWKGKNYHHCVKDYCIYHRDEC